MKLGNASASLASVAAAISLMFVMVACAGGATSQDIQSNSQGEASFVTAGTLDDLVAKSTLVVVGNVSGLGGTINMARDISDITKPDPLLFGVGQIYHVSVQRYIKGSGAPTLDLVQVEGFVNGQRSPVNASSIKQAHSKYPYIPLSSSNTYLMFLVPAQGFPAGQYFVGDIAPWRFTLPPGGMAEPESPWSGARAVFQPIPSEQLIAKVEQLVAANNH